MSLGETKLKYLRNAAEWRNAQRKPTVIANTCLNMLFWKKPIEGVAELNVDGTRNGHISKIGAGGVLCNHRCGWIKDFLVNLGIGDVLNAVAWSLFAGPRMVVECNFDLNTLHF